MPYKDEEDKSAYSKGYGSGYRKAVVDFLGGKCVKCGEMDYYQLEVHHVNGLEGRTGRDISDYKKILQGKEEAELLCKKCHPDTDNWKVKHR